MTDDEREANIYGTEAVNRWQEHKIKKGLDLEEKDKWICIFEVSVAKNEIVPDFNECRIRQEHIFASYRITKCVQCNIENCLAKIKAVRCPRDLIIGKDVFQYKLINVSGERSNTSEGYQPVPKWNQCEN